MAIENYFEWLKTYINGGDPNYESLLLYLFDYDFIWVHPLDENRYADGIDLRENYYYHYCTEEEKDIFIQYLDKPCSIFEMLIALSLRCGDLMASAENGADYEYWFWSMIESLGLMGMHNESFDLDIVSDICERLNNKTYASDGRGGLFTIKDYPYDIRDLEIWRQMNLYMNYILQKEDERC